jgi:cytochrome c oxidase cbb3-type subunit 3
MHTHKVMVASALAAFTVVVAHMSAQGTPQAPAPGAGTPQAPAPASPPPPEGRGQRGGGRAEAVFPAQQRAPGDPVLIERGKGLYTVNCSSCHGADLRGGGMGGPNLLRSQLVLADQAGELILPIVHGARADKGMPALPLSDADVKAVAEFVHSVLATAQRQGAPPPTEAPPPNAIVGDAKAGEAYFAANCSKCHSAGDLQGIGSRLPEGKALQNFWVAGGGGPGRGGGAGRGRGGRGGADAAGNDPRAVTATITLPSGEKVSGPIVRMDNFLVTVRMPDGTQRTFRRDGDRPKVEVKDPLEPHRTMLTSLDDKDMHDVTAYLATLK